MVQSTLVTKSYILFSMSKLQKLVFKVKVKLTKDTCSFKSFNIKEKSFVLYKLM